MPENPNSKWKQDRCVHCAAGVPTFSRWPDIHVDTDGGRLCQAPTPEAYIAELEARLENTEQKRKEAVSSHALFVSAGDVLCQAALEDSIRKTTERDQSRAALKVATDALGEISACAPDERPNRINYEDASEFHHDLAEYGCATVARAALTSEAVAVELARQKAQADELEDLRERIEEITNERDGAIYQLELRVGQPEEITSLRQQLADADRINAGIVRGRT